MRWNRICWPKSGEFTFYFVEFRAELSTYIISSQSDAIELRQREDFEKLSGDLQYFISQYSAGYTEIADLVNTELASVNDHTTMESLRSEASVKKHVSAEVTTAEKAITAHVTSETNGIIERISRVAIESDTQASTKEQRDRLLQSLRYPAMNERKSDLADSHQDTFRWIFADDAHEGDDSSNSYGTSDTSIITTSDNSSIDDFPSYHQSNLEDVPWDSFSDWLRSDSKIYWISGKPGSGKSTLMKYLLENPRTKAGLEIWAANPVILSHFFWKPGSKIQNNIKGFLCSILHQCVSFSTLMLDSVLTTSQSLLLKQSVTDWSMRELKEVCMDVLRCYPSPLCIFVDGLDEVCDEYGPHSILNYVNDIQAIPNVKICVASRPEPLLHSTLSTHQHLRLQDLTENDMRAYSRAQIQPYVTTHRISREFGSFTVDTLIYKAEGVFLWLHLAARSLIRGIENGDTQEEIGRRLNDLPNELSMLYSDMWARMNGDNKFYRESAARYFNLLIASRTLREGEYPRPPSLFHVMAATEIQVQHTFVKERTVMDPESLERLCNKAQHAIQVRCAGLLEVAKFRPLSYYNRSPVFPLYKGLVWDSSYEKISPHGTMNVQFIHRTAYDFVTNTEDGHQIRSYDTSTLSTLYIKLIKSELAYSKIFQYINVRTILHYSSQAISRSPQAEIHKLLRIAWNWYDDRYYSFFSDPLKKNRPTFLASAATFPRLNDFIRSSIADSLNPDLLAADILRNADYCLCLRRIDEFPNFINLIKDLSCRNNSVHWKGPCYTTSRSEPFAFFTPLSCLIQTVYRNHENAILEYGNSLVRLLHTFIQAGPDLDERIPLLICLSRQGPRVTFVEDGDDFTGGFDLSEYRDNRGMLEYILLVSNAAVLTRALLEKYRKHCNRPELPMILESENLNDPNRHPAANIKLITFCADNHPDPDNVRRFQPTSEEATGPLLALLMQFLFGDTSQTLYRRMRKELTNIRHEICGRSPKYEEVYKTPRAMLVEDKCGYWFVDDDGNPIEKDIDSNDDPDHGSNGDGPYEDRFYDDSDEEEWSSDSVDPWKIEAWE